MFDSLTRKELDERNSMDRENDVYDACRDDYNDDSWIPETYVLPNLHSKFSVAIRLEFLPGAEKLDREQVKTGIKNMLSKFKRANNGWRASGNGRDAQGEDGQKIRLMIRGVEYADRGLDDDDGEMEIKYCDDDRFRFCKDDIALAYMWGCLDMFGLCDFAMQNFEKWGLGDGKVGSARQVVTARNKTATNMGKEAIQKVMADLPNALKQMNAHLSDAHAQKESVAAEDQHRKALALHDVV